MGLPAKHRRMLAAIERSLRQSDPRLTALFAVFARLTYHEEIPPIEQVRRRAEVLFLRVRRRLMTGAAWLRVKPAGWVKAAVFFPLAFALVAASFAVGPKTSSATRCSRTPAAAGPAGNTALARSCGPSPMMPVFFGK
jgi:hypothetical protein